MVEVISNEARALLSPYLLRQDLEVKDTPPYMCPHMTLFAELNLTCLTRVSAFRHIKCEENTPF